MGRRRGSTEGGSYGAVGPPGCSNLLAAALPLLALLAGLPLLVLISWALRGAGDSTEPFETKGGTATRLDGTKATVQAVDISEAVRLHPREPIYVRGYLLAPPDDEDTLCTRLKEDGDCRGAPSLGLDTSSVELERLRRSNKVAVPLAFGHLALSSCE